MKLLLLFVSALAMSVGLSAEETWLDVGTVYTKPFSSQGYSGRRDDGIGGTLGVEELLGTHWTMGLVYESLKLDQPNNEPSFLGLINGSLRWMPGHGWMRPYGRVQVGAMAFSQSDAAQRSGGAPDGGVGIGVLFFADRAWAAEIGADAIRVLSQPSLDLLQGHAGLVVRFGAAPSAVQ